MQVYREKAYLANELLQTFAPIADLSNSSFLKLLAVLNDFEDVTRFGEQLPSEDKQVLMTFINSFNDYVQEQRICQELKIKFFENLTERTNRLIEEYRIAGMGG